MVYGMSNSSAIVQVLHNKKKHMDTFRQSIIYPYFAYGTYR